MATRFQARLEPLQSLQDLLPAICENLSLARAQISLDQIRAILHSGDRERIVCIAAGDFENSDLPLAAAIAIHPPAARDGEPRLDSATIVHAAMIGSLGYQDQKELATSITQCVDQQLRDRGVAFVQWSTDDVASQGNASIATWCRELGFEPLATLEYLSANLDDESHCSDPVKASNIRFDPLDWAGTDELSRFAALVEQTYIDTLDCSRLSEYRTAIQTLRGYQSSSAFAPDWWFRLVDSQTGEQLGSLILGHHRGHHRGHRDDVEGGENAGDVVEIVYMGLVPSARGRGLGAKSVQIAKAIACRDGCSRIILAVDQRNHTAKSIYLRAGLQVILSETIWVKSLLTA